MPLSWWLQVKDTKKAKFKLGVSEAKLGSAIQVCAGCVRACVCLSGLYIRYVCNECV